MNNSQDVYNKNETEDWKTTQTVIGQTSVTKYEEDDEQWFRTEIIVLSSPQVVDISYIVFITQSYEYIQTNDHV